MRRIDPHFHPKVSQQTKTWLKRSNSWPWTWRNEHKVSEINVWLDVTKKRFNSFFVFDGGNLSKVPRAVTKRNFLKCSQGRQLRFFIPLSGLDGCAASVSVFFMAPPTHTHPRPRYDSRNRKNEFESIISTARRKKNQHSGASTSSL